MSRKPRKPLRHLKVNEDTGGILFRRSIPKAISPLFGGETSIRRYLRTDLATAIATRDELDTGLDQLFNKLKRLPDADKAEIIAIGGVLKAPAHLTELGAIARVLDANASKQEQADEDELGPDLAAQSLLSARRARQGAERYRQRLRDLASVSAVLGAPTPPPARDSVAAYLKRWNLDKAASTQSNRDNMHRAVTRFLASIGADVGQPVKAVATRDNVRTFIAALTADTTQRHAYRQAQLQSVRSFLTYCVNEGVIDTNPATGLAVPAPAGQSKAATATGVKMAFPPDQLRAIIGWFDNRAATAKGKKAKAATEQRWIIRLCAFNGLRVEEALQLWSSDIATTDGIATVAVHDRHPGNHVKNVASIRTIPVHPRTLADGFPTFVAASTPDAPLFPLTARPGYRKSATFTSYVSNVLRTRIGITDRRLSLHSARHSFISACARSGMPKYVEYQLAGHADKQSGAHGGYIGKFPMATLAEWLAKVDPLSLDAE